MPIAGDEWIMTVSGFRQLVPLKSNPINTNVTELFNVKTGQTCFLPDLPFDYMFGAVGAFFQGMPIVCGGKVNYGGNNVEENNPSCLVFQQGSWKLVSMS